MVTQFGGLRGFKDEGLFLSALNRPQDKWLYGQGSEPPDIFDLAAAYGFGLTKNHGFHDGNKRIGASSCLLFLRLNGIEISLRSQEQLITIFVAVARGRASEAKLACWLRRRAA